MKSIVKSVYFGWGEGCSGYTVGNRGVTEIKPQTKNGEMALITYFEVWAGDKLIAEMHQYSEIVYCY